MHCHASCLGVEKKLAVPLVLRPLLHGNPQRNEWHSYSDVSKRAKTPSLMQLCSLASLHEDDAKKLLPLGIFSHWFRFTMFAQCRKIILIRPYTGSPWPTTWSRDYLCPRKTSSLQAAQTIPRTKSSRNAALHSSLTAESAACMNWEGTAFSRSCERLLKFLPYFIVLYRGPATALEYDHSSEGVNTMAACRCAGSP